MASWHSEIVPLFGERISFEQGARNQGNIEQVELALTQLLRIQGGQLRLTASNVQTSNEPMFSLLLHREGTGVIGQASRSWHLQKDSLVLLDANAESWLSLSASFHQILLLFPASFLGGSEPALGALEGMTNPIDRLLRDALIALDEEQSPLERAALLSAVLALLRESTAGWSRHREQPLPSVRVRRAERYIDAHLGDRTLNAERVAAAQKVSRRWLDSAFHAQGATVAEAIRERRLQASAVLLATRRDMSVLDIAMACGFVSASAFSHAFRKRFEQSPLAWRNSRTLG